MILLKEYYVVTLRLNITHQNLKDMLLWKGIFFNNLEDSNRRYFHLNFKKNITVNVYIIILLKKYKLKIIILKIKQ